PDFQTWQENTHERNNRDEDRERATTTRGDARTAPQTTGAEAPRGRRVRGRLAGAGPPRRPDRGPGPALHPASAGAAGRAAPVPRQRRRPVGDRDGPVRSGDRVRPEWRRLARMSRDEC